MGYRSVRDPSAALGMTILHHSTPSSTLSPALSPCRERGKGSPTAARPPACAALRTCDLGSPGIPAGAGMTGQGGRGSCLRRNDGDPREISRLRCAPLEMTKRSRVAFAEREGVVLFAAVEAEPEVALAGEVHVEAEVRPAEHVQVAVWLRLHGVGAEVGDDAEAAGRVGLAELDGKPGGAGEERGLPELLLAHVGDRGDQGTSAAPSPERCGRR